MWIADKLKLTCVKCKREYPWSVSLQCADCNYALIDVDYNLANAKVGTSGCTMERYYDFLPITSREQIIDGGEGNTPVLHAKELGKAAGLNKLYLKLESANPTRTTKDRQGTMAVATFRDLGIRHFVTSSTGNSCTALARIVSRFPDMQMSIFIGGEFLQRLNWVGAPNVTVYWLPNGTFVDAHNAAKWFCQESGATGERGFFFFAKREGLKTAYMEAVDQIPEPITAYFQSISSAMGVYSTYKAAKQLQGIGKIEKMPRMMCVQEETCNPMVRSWDKGLEAMDAEDIIPFPSGYSKATLRGNPAMVYPYVSAAVRDSGGTMVTCKQEDLLRARETAKELEGLDICHTSSMTVVAAKHLREIGVLAEDDVIMVNITGADRTNEPHPPADYIVEKDGDCWSITPARKEGADAHFERVANVLSQSTKIPAGAMLEPSTKLVGGGLGLDSVSLLEFSLALEREFNCEIHENDLNPENFSTLGAVAALMNRNNNGSLVASQ